MSWNKTRSSSRRIKKSKQRMEKQKEEMGESVGQKNYARKLNKK
jgi:hypothetical protein